MQLFQGKPCHHACHAFLSLFLILSACQSQKSQNREEDKSAAAAQADSVQHQRHAILLHDHDGNDYDPALEAANFIATIDHPYFNLLPGRVWTYEGKDEDGEVDRVEIEVTSDTKVILGVTTTVVREREWKNGELEEDTFDWFAQDREGNVWYFGEDSKEIDDGKIASTEGSWEAGKKGAKPGIVMKAQPQVGDAYRQEYLKGEAEDMGQVLSTDAAITIGLGNYAHCVQIKDWTPLEPEVVEHKFYSKDVGNLVAERKIAGEAGGVELVEMKTK